MRILVVIAALSMLAACSSQPAKPTQTPAQTLAIVCPAVESSIAALQAWDAAQTPNTATANGQKLATLATQVAAVCAVGAAATSANVQQFATDVLPALNALVATLPMSAKEREQIAVGLIAADTVLGIASASNVPPTP